MKLFSAWRSWNSPRRGRRAAAGHRVDTIESLEIRVLPAATTLGPVINVPSRVNGYENYDAIAANPDGSFTVVFSDSGLDSDGWGVYARRFSANGVPLGNQYRINAVVADNQQNPSIATNTQGESLAVWFNERFAGGFTYPISLDMRFLDSSGVPQGNNINLIPEDYSETVTGHYLDGTQWGYANDTRTFVDSSDQFWVVVPISFNYFYIAKKFQFYQVSTEGTAEMAFETELVNETDTNTTVPIPVDVRMGPDGTFYVLYDTEHNEAVPDVGQEYTSQLLVRRISSSTGEQIGSDIVVHSATYLDDPYRVEHSQPVLVPEADGNFSVVYYNRTKDLVTQHFNANGNKAGSLIKLIDHTDLNGDYGASPVAVGVLSNGNWLMTWAVPVAFDDDTSYVQEFRTDGTAEGHPIELGTAYYHGTPHIASQGNDQFVVSWQDGGGIASFGDVFARRVVGNVAVPGVTITPLTALETSEAGGQATIQFVLDAPPIQNVTIPFQLTHEDFASLSASQLVFTPGNWNVPQQLTLTGINDFVILGDVFYELEIGPTISSDTGYNNLSFDALLFVNYEDDVAGVSVTPLSGLQVSESGTTATFTVALTSQPYENVTISVASSDTTEGTINKNSLFFTPVNWNAPQVVTITGVNDALTDGNVPFQITLGSAVSDDFDYGGLNVPDVSVTNFDNDVPGVSVTPTTALTTSESGTTAGFQVVLQTQPSGDVTISLQSDDASEGTPNKTTLTFTAANWNVPQMVTVTGQNDDIDDGDVTYHATFTSVTSADPTYNNLSVASLTLQNADNDTAGFTVTPASGLQTTEAGGAAMFTVRLTSQPLNDVTISVTSSDTDEGTASVLQLVFTQANWDAPQSVTVTGVDDGIADGTTAYQILLGSATSSDETYNGLDPQDVSLTNRTPNVAPTLQLTGSNPTFGKRGAPVSLISSAVVADDLSNFAGGRIRISIKAGYDVNDMLIGSTTIGGLSIGTLSHSGSDYFVDLNSNATPAALQQLLQSVKFSTAKKGLRSPSRTIEFQLTDSEAAVSSTVQLAVQVSRKKLK